MDDFKELLESFGRLDGAAMEQINAVEDAMKVRFPDDYRSVLQWANGGGATTTDDEEFGLWGVEEIQLLNEDYKIGTYLPGIIGIGTNCGGECYALDYRTNLDAPSLVRVPFGDLETGAIVLIEQTFREGVERLIKG